MRLRHWRIWGANQGSSFQSFLRLPAELCRRASPCSSFSRRHEASFPLHLDRREVAAAWNLLFRCYAVHFLATRSRDQFGLYPPLNLRFALGLLRGQIVVA